MFDGCSDRNTEQMRRSSLVLKCLFCVRIRFTNNKKKYKIYENRENNIRSVRALRSSSLTSQALAI